MSNIHLKVKCHNVALKVQLIFFLLEGKIAFSYQDI